MNAGTELVQGRAQKLTVCLQHTDRRGASHFQRLTSTREEADFPKVSRPGDCNAGFPFLQRPRCANHVVVDHKEVVVRGLKNGDVAVRSRGAGGEAELHN
jgi:hypothetical protein